MTFCLFSRCRTDEEGYLHQRNTNIYWAFTHYINCSTEKREREMKRVLVRSSRNRVFSLQRDQHEAWLWLTEPDRNTHGRSYGWRLTSLFLLRDFVCVSCESIRTCSACWWGSLWQRAGCGPLPLGCGSLFLWWQRAEVDTDPARTLFTKRPKRNKTHKILLTGACSHHNVVVTEEL